VAVAAVGGAGVGSGCPIEVAPGEGTGAAPAGGTSARGASTGGASAGGDAGGQPMPTPARHTRAKTAFLRATAGSATTELPGTHVKAWDGQPVTVETSQTAVASWSKTSTEPQTPSQTVVPPTGRSASAGCHVPGRSSSDRSSPSPRRGRPRRLRRASKAATTAGRSSPGPNGHPDRPVPQVVAMHDVNVDTDSRHVHVVGNDLDHVYPRIVDVRHLREASPIPAERKPPRSTFRRERDGITWRRSGGAR
jgi:hypothetical protein